MILFAKETLHQLFMSLFSAKKRKSVCLKCIEKRMLVYLVLIHIRTLNVIILSSQQESQLNINAAEIVHIIMDISLDMRLRIHISN